MATRKIFTNQEFQPSALLVNPKVHSISDLSQHTGSVGQLVTNNANLYFHDGSNWFALIESNYSGLLTGAPEFDPSSGNVPFNVGSGHTGRVDNLNSDLVDGYHASLSANALSVAVRSTNGRLEVGTPVSDSDAATKLYVDNAIQGLDIKASVAAATTGNITLSGNQTIDGISITAGMRVLVKDQSTASENGIYVSSASAWALADDSDAQSLSDGAYVFVEGGTVGNNTGWTYVNDGAYTWVQFSGAGQITAGDGLTKTGDTLNASVASPLSISNDQITIADGAISGVKLDSGIAGDGLAFTTGVLSVNVSGPLSISADTLTIADGAIGGAKLNTAIAGDGLGISAGVLSVNVSGPLSIDTDTLTIADGAIGGAKLNTAIAGDGLGISAGVLGVNVSGPISISGDSLTIADGALTGSKLANDTVTSTQLANSITVTDLLVQDVSLATLIVGSTGGAGAELILDGAANGDGSGGDAAYIKMTSGDDLHIVNQQTAGTMLFATGSVTRATIASDGKVKLFQNTGIGVDPSSTYKLLVSGDSKIDGTLEVSTPTANAHATTKLYVDDAVSAASVSNIVAGDGLAKSGNTLSVNTTGPISIASDSLTIADGAIGGAKLNTAIAGDGLGISAGVLSVNVTGPISISNDSLTIADGAITAAKLAAPVPVTSGGTGSTTQETAGRVLITGTNGVYTTDSGLRYDASNDYLGIGGSPDSTLSLQNVGTDLDFILADNPATGDQNIQIQGGSGDTLGIATGATGPGLVLDTSNRLGVRTDSMSSMDSTADDLVVGDGLGHYGITLYSAATYKGTIAFGNPNSNYQGAIVYDHNNDSLALFTGGTSRLSIDSSGNGSITGTFSVATPTAGGHATTKTYVDNAVSAADVSNLVAGDGLAKSGNTLSVNTTSPISISSDSLTIADGALTGAKLANNTVTSTQLADTIQVSSLGVGVSPSHPLDVYSASGGCTVQFSANLSNAYEGSTLKLKGGNLATNKIMLGDVSDEDIGAISYANNGNTMTFDVNAATRLTIEADGDVQVHNKLGVGVTPSTTLHIKSADPVLRFEDSAPDGVYGQIDGAGGSLILTADGGNGAGSSAIKFRIDGTTSSSDKAVLNSQGTGGAARFGIGVTPDNTLHLQADDCEVKIERTGSYADTLFMGFPSGLPFIAGADGLAFGASGKWTEHMRLTSSGELQLKGNGVLKNQESGGNFSYLQQTSSDARLFVQYSQPLLLGTAATTRLTIEATGTVKVHEHLFMGRSNDPKIYAGSGVGLQILGEHLYLNQTNTKDVVMVQGGGSTGIGVSPSHKLHVRDASTVLLANQPNIISEFTGTGTDGRILIGVTHEQSSTASALGAGIRFRTRVDTSGTAGYLNSYIFQNSPGQGHDMIYVAPKNMSFYVDAHDNDLTGTTYVDFGTHALEIQEDGNTHVANKLGVGVSPTELLTLKGQGHSVPTFTIQRTDSTTTQFRITNAENSAATTSRGTSTGQWANVIDSNNSNLFLTSRNAGGTGGSIVLDADNVGIGQTIPTERLHISSGQVFSDDNANSNGPNFRVNTTNKDGSEYAYVAQRSGSAVGGVLIDGRIKSAVGSTANPGISFTTDGDTGINRPAANTMAFSTGGSERMRLTSAGSVGVGTTSPTNKLTVNSGSQYTKAYLSQTADIHIANTSGSGVGAYAGALSFSSTNEANLQGASIAAIQTGSDQNQIGLTFNTQPSQYGSFDLVEAVRIKHDGKLGVGTTSPGEKVEIHQNGNYQLKLTNGSTGGGNVRIAYADNAFGSGGSKVVFDLDNGGSANAELVIQNDGRVGISNVSPTFKLDVSGDARINDSGAANGTASQTMQVVNTASGATSSYIYVGASSGADWKIGKNVLGTLSRTNFDITTHADVSALTITPSTNVGIGLTDPGSYKLNVEHSAGQSIRVGQSGGVGLEIGHTAYSLSNSYTGIKNTDWTGTSDYALLVGSAHTYVSSKIGGTLHLRGGGNQSIGGVYIYGNGSVVINEAQGDADFRVEGDTDPNLLFCDASTDRVGIGTASPSAKLDVRGRQYMLHTGADATILHMHNNSATGYGAYLRVDNSDVSRYALRIDSGTSQNLTVPNSGGLILANLTDNVDQVKITREGYSTAHSDAKLFIYDNSNSDWGQIVRLGNYSYGLKVDQWVDYGFALFQQTSGQVFAARTGGIVVNEDGGNYDFRVEGDTDQNLLVCDASADSVGIGTSSPSYKLDVAGEINTSSTYKLSGNNVVAKRQFVVSMPTGSGYSSSYFYPVHLYMNYTSMGAIDNTYVSVRMPSQSGSSSYNAHNMYGWIVGGGWSDHPSYCSVYHTFYDTNERSILGVYRSTQNAYGPVVYLRGGRTYYITTTANTADFSTSALTAGNSTFAVKNADGSDYSGTSANISLLFDTYNTDKGRLEPNNLFVSGSVGIGTTSPQYKLDVAGTINSSSAIYAADVVVSGATPTITLNDTDGDANAATAYVQFQQGGTAIGKVGDIASGRSAMMLYADSGKELMLFTNGQNATSDTPAITIDTSQNVGVGTASPTAKLDIRGAGADGDELLRIESSGNVTDGGYHWMTSEMATGQTTDANIIHLIGRAQSSKNSGYFGFNYQADGSDSNFITLGGYAANNLLNIKMDGNVGIGTTDPTQKLHVYVGNASAPTDSNTHAVIEDSDHSYLGIYGGTSSDVGIHLGDTAIDARIAYHNSSRKLAFYAGGGPDQLTLDSNGNVGIGTTSPSYKLHVSGNSYIDATSAGSTLTLGRYNGQRSIQAGSDDGGYLIMDSSGAGTGRAALNWYSGDDVVLALGGGSVGVGTASPDLQLHVKSSSGNSNLLLQRESYTGWQISAGSTYLTFLQYGGSELLRIQNTGNVGIGTTSPSAQLHINEDTTNSYGTLKIEGANRGGLIDMFNGTYPVSRFLTDQSGNIYISTSGAFGSGSLTTKLTIATGGNVGIGTTSPSYKLDFGTSANGDSIRIVPGHNYTALRVGGGNNDVGIFRVGVDDGQYNVGQYGFTMKYMGTRNGNLNSLSIFADQQTSSTQTEAFTMTQNGFIGLGYTNPSERLSVDGGVYISGECTINDTLDVSDISINGVTTANKYLGTNSSGTLEWKDGDTNPYVTAISITGYVSGNSLVLTVGNTRSGGANISDMAIINMSGMTCPTDCASGS